MERFGDYLYKARFNKKGYITQRRLAELSGYTQTYISLIETGKAKPSERCRKALLKSYNAAIKELI